MTHEADDRGDGVEGALQDEQDEGDLRQRAPGAGGAQDGVQGAQDRERAQQPHGAAGGAQGQAPRAEVADPHPGQGHRAHKDHQHARAAQPAGHDGPQRQDRGEDGGQVQPAGVQEAVVIGNDRKSLTAILVLTPEVRNTAQQIDGLIIRDPVLIDQFKEAIAQINKRLLAAGETGVGRVTDFRILSGDIDAFKTPTLKLKRHILESSDSPLISVIEEMY